MPKEVSDTMNIKYAKSMFTTRELASLLNIHINTARRWSDQGVIKSYRIGKRQDRRFSREDVLSFLGETPQSLRSTSEEKNG
jgi:excisionase family DNA binding protein